VEEEREQNSVERTAGEVPQKRLSLEPTSVDSAHEATLEPELLVEPSSGGDVAIPRDAASSALAAAAGGAAGGPVGEAAASGVTEETAAEDEEASH
jgi:hypothetical protein